MSITPFHNPTESPTPRRRGRGPCTFKQRDLTAAVKAVAKAGVEITGVRIAPDGNIVVSVGRAQEPVPENEWDNVLVQGAPKYVKGYVDRNGKARFYFRRSGFNSVALPGLPWSPVFMAAYEEALAGQRMEIGSAHVKAGSMRALAVSYFGFVDFRSMKANSRYVPAQDHRTFL